MIRVRWPDGTAFVYNDATKCKYLTSYTELSTAEGNWVASIHHSAGCVIERVSPCRIEGNHGIEQALGTVLANLKHANKSRVRELKRALQQFNSKSCSWRDQ